MRIIGGTLGGRRLQAVDGHRTRPTSDRVREALFSRIEARYGLAGQTVLDVFSGTGALAIEALSRGAARAVCIEVERRAVETLRQNVRDLDLAAKVRIIADDYKKVLPRLRPFDGVFLDPPYGMGLAAEALAAVAKLGLVKDGGWVTVELGRRDETQESVAGPAVVLRRVREDAYGDTKLALYEAGLQVTDEAGNTRMPAEVER